MCRRQWVRFYCGDFRYAEIRCDRNPAGRPFEDCDTRQTTALSRKVTGPMCHPDPGLFQSPGRCIDWDRIPGMKIGFVKDVMFDNLTWVPCSKEWHATNSGNFERFAPDPYNDASSRNGQMKIPLHPQKRVKIRFVVNYSASDLTLSLTPDQ
ncbi:hypothetical protein EAE96_003479 [Botrytis aclada]|nr:hypothetical protein EAE96_003479 [Botrytis aclada]